jgi:hypothetical protein
MKGTILVMASNSSSGHDVKFSSLTVAQIDKLLSMTLVANLVTLDEDDTIHIVAYRPDGLFKLVTKFVFPLVVTPTNTKT